MIEDAAHALGSEYKGRRIGSMSDMTTFSFHPVKPITTGEGGMIVTDSEELYRKLVLFRSHGITRDPDLMTRNEGPWFYQLDLGYNYPHDGYPVCARLQPDAEAGPLPCAQKGDRQSATMRRLRTARIL